MLKTSPVITTSAHASPTFRYAPSTTTSDAAASTAAINSSPSSLHAASSPHSRHRRRGSSSRPPSSSAHTPTTIATATSTPLKKSPAQIYAPAPAAAAGLASTSHASSISPASTVSTGASTSHLTAAAAMTSARSTPTVPPLPPTPTPKPHDASANIPAPSTTAGLPVPDQVAEPILSPNKRRGSPPAQPGPSQPTQEAAAEAEAPPKRSRPAEQPAKILPARYELCNVPDIVELVAHMIGELITTNDAIRVANGGLTRFHSRTAPGISVRDYLHRLARHATLTPPLLLAMVYYIDRLCAMYPEFTINTLTVHRFLITAATVAAKGLSDAFWNNTTYARVGGIRVNELRMLELEFLYRVDWRIVPNPEVLVAYYRGLVERTPGYELEDGGDSDEDIEDDEEV